MGSPPGVFGRSPGSDVYRFGCAIAHPGDGIADVEYLIPPSFNHPIIKSGSSGWNYRFWDANTDICVGCKVQGVKYRVTMTGHGVYCGFGLESRMFVDGGSWYLEDWGIQCHESGLYYI